MHQKMKFIVCVLVTLTIVAYCQGHKLQKRSLDQLLGTGLGNIFGASSGGGGGGGLDIGSLLQAKLGGVGGYSGSDGYSGSGRYGLGGYSSGYSNDHVDHIIYVKIIEGGSHGGHYDNYNHGNDHSHGGWNSGW